MSLLTIIDQVPLYTTIEEALIWGTQYNITGYHTHVYNGVTGYMPGQNHEQITNALAGGIINFLTPQQLAQGQFVVTPEAKALNEIKDDLMENFYRLKESGCGILINKNEEYKIFGPLNLIDKVLEIGKAGLQINRYKGLGEMNPDQLWETTLDQNERILLSVKINEVDAANKAFEDLMGGETDARKKFIAENSLKVANLDI